MRTSIEVLLSAYVSESFIPVTYTLCLKKVPPSTCYNFDTRSDCDNFCQKCYRESKKSDDALFSYPTYLVLQHYLAKEETQKTAHWCIVRAAQSNCRSALDFLSPEPCPQQPELNALITRFCESYNSVSMSRESKRLKKSSSWLNSGNTLVQRVKMQFFYFPFCQVVQKHKLFEVA